VVSTGRGRGNFKRKNGSGGQIISRETRKSEIQSGEGIIGELKLGAEEERGVRGFNSICETYIHRGWGETGSSRNASG